MILRERLAELLFRQSWNDVQEAALPSDDLSPWLRDRYLKQADEIIELFTDAIRGLEFKTSASVPDGK